MYQVGAEDRVVELRDLPQMDTGAPMPAVIANEHVLDLVYLTIEIDPNWDGSYSTMVGEDTERDEVACVRFGNAWAHSFGSPGDETLNGHPLWGRGLSPYAASEVHHSSWIRSLERMNSVHSNHTPAMFDGLRHFIFTFHDSTFECVAKGYECRVVSGSMKSVTASLASIWR